MRQIYNTSVFIFPFFLYIYLLLLIFIDCLQGSQNNCKFTCDHLAIINLETK